MSLGFCQGSRVEGNMLRVEGKMSTIYLMSFIVYIFIITFFNIFFVS